MVDNWSTCESIAQLKPVTTSTTFLLPNDDRPTKALTRPEARLGNALFDNIKRKAAAAAESAAAAADSTAVTPPNSDRRVPGRHMAQRAALRQSKLLPDPNSQHIQTRRDGALGGTLRREQIDPEVLKKVLRAIEEEELRQRPLPARPALWEVLQGPRALPKGLERHVARMSSGRTRQLEKLQWMAKVDGKRPTGTADDDDVWASIVDNRWKELDDVLTDA